MNALKIAIVGASPNNDFTVWVLKNLRAMSPDATIWPVSARHDSVLGIRASPSVEGLPGSPTIAIVAIRREETIAVLEKLIERGAQDIVLVSAGFDERGDDIGRDLNRRLLELVADSDVRIWGPNCVGFADVTAGICALTEPVPTEMTGGPVSVISQSGALLSNFLASLVHESVGIDWCVSIGNGAVVGVAGAIRIAAARPTTKVICIYMEGISSPQQLDDFRAALHFARDEGKVLVVLKSGVSSIGQRAVLSHTASIAGSDAALSALLHDAGAVRVDSVDELIRSATIALLGVAAGRERAVAVFGSSGGSAALASDAAERTGTRLSRLSDATRSSLAEQSVPGSFIDNPFDLISGGRVRGPDGPLGTIFRAPEVGLVLAAWSIKYPDDSPDEERHRQTFQELSELSALYEVPTLVASAGLIPRTTWVDEFIAAHPHVRLVEGLDLTFRCLAPFFPAPPTAADKGADEAPGKVLSEAESRDVLAGVGFDVVHGVTTVAGAPEDLLGLRPPFAVKVVAPVGHKSKIGGVELGVPNAADVPQAIATIRASLSKHGYAESIIEGFLVEEMSFGREILVGLDSDPIFGRSLTIGLGGAATELARRTRMSLLPVTLDHIVKTLTVFGVGHDASVPLAQGIHRLAEEFMSGALCRYRTIEINPVVVSSDSYVAVDALVVPGPELFATEPPGAGDRRVDA